MINFCKITFRNFKKNFTYSLLNIGGLSIGISCAFLILLWIQDEINYDRFHANGNELYRVLENQYYGEGDAFPVAVTPSGLSPALKKDFPEIIRSSRFQTNWWLVQKENEQISQEMALVDHDFLKMFDIHFISGDINSALNDPHSIVLSESAAEKYFGEEDAMGKTLTINKTKIFTVTGIVKEFSGKSHFQFKVLIPFKYLGERGTDINNWGTNAYHTLVQLQEGTNSNTVDIKIEDFIQKYQEDSGTKIFLQNVTRTHLYSSGIYAADFGGLGDISYIRIFSIVALFILLIACINFMNLSTAQASLRAKEVGVRKIIGANRRKLVLQFFGESMLFALVALILAMFIVALLLPDFNIISGKNLTINYHDFSLYLSLTSIVVICGLLAGSYPALFLSSIDPLKIVKGVIGKTIGKTGFRRVLVIVQFSLSIFLIICTLTIGSQLKYMQNKKLGLNKENIGYFWFGDDIKKHSSTLKEKLLKNPNIFSSSMSNAIPTYIGNSSDGFNWDGKTEGNNVLFHFVVTDEDYDNTFKLQMKEGRFFSKDFTSDKSAVVINEKSAQIMGFEQPVGKKLSAWGEDFKIVGVVNDFHFKSVHNKIEPLVMFLDPDRYNVCFVRMHPDNVSATVDYIKNTYKQFDKTSTMHFKFLDNDYNNLYQSEQRMGSLFNYFSILAIIISCLGLIGLSSFVALRRTKEIGIRKTNGAKTIEVYTLMVKAYIAWVGFSIIIAVPFAFFSMQRWLEGFAYKTELSWWVFALAGMLALGIALLTVSWQTWRAARRNPVDALRYE